MENKEKNGKFAWLGYATEFLNILCCMLSPFADNPIVGIVFIFACSCLTFIVVHKALRGKNKVVCILFTVIVCVSGITLTLFSNSWKKEEPSSRHTIPENAREGKLELEFEDFILSYSDTQENGKITDSLKNGLIVETCTYESYDYDAKIDNYKLENNILTFEGIPSGNCAINIKFENYNLVSETFTLNKKDMQDGIWKKCITLREETDFKNFSVKILDKLGKPLSGDTCDILLGDIAEKIAEFKGIALEEVAKHTYENTIKVFKINNM